MVRRHRGFCSGSAFALPQPRRKLPQHLQFLAQFRYSVWIRCSPQRLCDACGSCCCGKYL